MIDLHTHLLPNVDDGSNALALSKQLIEEAIDDGISDIVLTPHYSYLDNYVVKKKELNVMFNSFKNELKDLNINLYLGNEILIEKNTDELLNQDCLCTINNTKYVLIEFPFNEYDKEYDEFLYNIDLLGYKIIIAHPERYEFINEEIINNWLACGYYIQANASSLFIPNKRRMLFKLIKQGKLSLFASDAHNEYRKPLLKEAYDLIQNKFNKEVADILFETNPYNIINDLKIVKLPVVKRKLFNI